MLLALDQAQEDKKQKRWREGNRTQGSLTSTEQTSPVSDRNVFLVVVSTWFAASPAALSFMVRSRQEELECRLGTFTKQNPYLRGHV